jgi:alkylation response protein AidB-like acyl-CoA dehydrogenase
MIDGESSEFVAVAQRALEGGSPSTALASLGWWQLLRDLDEGESRRALFSVFRAQGRALTSSTALAALLAAPYLDALELDPGTVAATAIRASRRRGMVHVAIGDFAGMQILVDRPGLGASALNLDDVRLERIEVPGRLDLHAVHVDEAHWRPTIAEDTAAPARRQSVALGRVALALEMLGAAEGALELATEHARSREQFGRPIGAFQAVQHLLAWAMTDCAAIEGAAHAAVAFGATLPPRFDAIVKALAGRNARRACERTLQTLGAIGFTAEHAHHHFHSRVLALDSLLGTSADLTHDLGRWLREESGGSQLPTALLVPATPDELLGAEDALRSC